ncbi:factor-independent urate hydroxylase [Allostreptomyces psammosilenae]|uniref:Uricase n=1 Tax=Allostreptomyces psammosilenae TaxID=1892865 RepID=A0A853A677_9ACTN|nr:urate oxidase [Allostreptomyces psammosilenae]NYI08354.1 urate oxidase [Allostreptomyces psammosilenae]
MTTVLGQNQYGKAEVRLVRVVRDTPRHSIRDLNVSIALSGELEATHLTGSNAQVLPTDTAKNTVYAFARDRGVGEPEDFAIELAGHFVTSQPTIHRARVRVEEYLWDRIEVTGAAADAPAHSFVRSGTEVRTCEILFDGTAHQAVSGLKELTVLNSTGSEFHGFVEDRYTTLRPATDRILATRVDARWRHAWTGGDDRPDFAASYAAAQRHLLEAFATTHSLSLQQTLYAMGRSVIRNLPGVDEIRLSLPNKHHFLVDLEPFGLENPGEVFHAADRPYGLIEGTVLREGAAQLLPTD